MFWNMDISFLELTFYTIPFMALMALTTPR